MIIESARLRFHLLHTTLITIVVPMLLLSSTLIPFSTVYAEAKKQTTVDNLSITLQENAHSLTIQYFSVVNPNQSITTSCQKNLNGNSHFSVLFAANHHSFAFGSIVTLHAWSGTNCDQNMLDAQRWILPKFGVIINSTCVLDMTSPQTHPTGCTNGNSPNSNDTNTVVATLSVKLPTGAQSLMIQYFSRVNASQSITSPCQKNLNGNSQFSFEFSSADHHSFASGSTVTLNAWAGQQCDGSHIKKDQKWTLPTDGTVASSICDLDMTSHKTSTSGC